MNEIKVVNEQVVLGKEFKIYGSMDNPLFLAKDVAEMIDYAKTGKGSYDVSKMLKLVDEEEKLVRKIFDGHQNRDMLVLTKSGVKQVLVNSRNYKAKKLLKYIDDAYMHKNVAKETSFGDTLSEVLSAFGINFETQYNVLKYRIDFYIPVLNIAIEYDENNHKYYTYNQQNLRQSLIEQELGCRFIRVSDDCSDAHNAGLVIKEIFNIAS